MCAWDVCYIIFCHLLHIHSGILFSLLLCSLWWVQIVGYVLACRSCSFDCTWHHLIIVILQTYLKTLNLWNACQIYFVECVSKIQHNFSVIYYTIYGAVCFQFTNSPCDDWENIHFVLSSSSNRNYMNYYPLFRVRSWNNGMRCMSLYILMTSSNGNIFRVTGHLCGEITGHRWIPRTSQWDRALKFSLICPIIKRLSKQWWGWWFEHCCDTIAPIMTSL